MTACLIGIYCPNYRSVEKSNIKKKTLANRNQQYSSNLRYFVFSIEYYHRLAPANHYKTPRAEALSQTRR